MENLTPEEPNIEMDLEYLTYKRDDALEHFNDNIKSHLLTDEGLHKKLDVVLRMNHQVKIMTDILVVSRLTKQKEKK